MANDWNEADRKAKALFDRLRRAPDVVKEAATASLMKQAERVADEMRKRVPVDSGDLRDSIVVTPPDASTPPYSTPGGKMIVPEMTVAITVGNSAVRYAHLVEFGTVQTQAQPFFLSTWRDYKKKTATNIKSAIKRAIKKNDGKA